MVSDSKSIREKPHRLPDECYAGSVSVAFTACTENRVAFFQDDQIVDTFGAILRAEAARFECDVLVYLFMPDHCHVLLRGKNEKAHMLNAMKAFKQKTGYWLAQNRPGLRWQKDFYDHILRSEAEVSKQLRYILENPLRKNLVQDWKEYRAMGSTLADIDEWSF